MPPVSHAQWSRGFFLMSPSTQELINRTIFLVWFHISSGLPDLGEKKATCGGTDLSDAREVLGITEEDQVS